MTKSLFLSQKNLFNSEKIIALIALFIAVFAISFASIFIKWSEFEIGANATVFNRSWIATVILGFWNSLNFVYLKISNSQDSQESFQNNPYEKNVILLLLALGVLSLGFQSLWAWSITQINISISTILHYLTPIFTTLSAWLFFNKRFDGTFLSGGLLALIGMMIIGIKDLQIDNSNILGDGASLLSAVFYAGYLLIIEELRPKLSATQILMWSSLTGAILTIPILIFTGEKFFPHSWNCWLTVICLALICQVFGQGMLAYSLNKLSSGFVALCLILDPILTAIEACLIFAEKLVLLDWIAFFLVLLGINFAIFSQSSMNDKQSI